MTKLLMMSDPHLTAGGETIIGLDPGARLTACLAHAARHHPQADRLVLLGDLAHYGRPAEYALLRRLLDGLPWPVSLMLGNHDDRPAFRAAFPEVPVDASGHVQSLVDLPGLRLILLDTLDGTGAAPPASGRLCAARMAWLEAALEGAAGRTTLVCLHHPPFETGFAGMDAIGLHDAPRLRALLSHHGVAHVFCGHIHRRISASVGGLPFEVFKSTCHQMPMLLGEPGTGHSVDEPGAYAIVLARGGDIVVHVEDVGDTEPAIGQAQAS